MLVLKNREGLAVQLGLRLHIDEHRLRQIDRQEEIGLVRGDLRFDHLYTIQVAILTITNLDRHDPFEVPETFNLHRVGIDRPSISIHVGFGAVEPKDRFVLKRDVDVIYVRRSQSNTLAVAPQVSRQYVASYLFSVDL